jgi:hypothetical protein
LQIAQRPPVQVHTGIGLAALCGPQLRTHASAAGSLRSGEPPGHERRSKADASRLASVSARLEIASM